MKNGLWNIVLAGAWLLVCMHGNAAEFFVDAVNGNDTNDGTGWAIPGTMRPSNL